MTKKLVIVESPSKSKTIGKYLGKDYIVTSSKGHVRDLATSGKDGLGVDIEDHFKPKYVINKDKKDVVKELKADIKKVDEVLLATDPDREGEAISWHLADLLGLDMEANNRVEFHEVTKDAIIKAIENPRTINQQLVRSQETRRVLDRIIGFKLSKLLRQKIKSKSAGRVQSVALKLIVDREREIEAFIPEEYWEIKALFEKNGINFEAELSKYNNKKVKIKNEDQAMEIFNSLNKEFIVSELKKTQKRRESKAPFITSTLQQEASTKLGFSAKKTMSLAQKLYEGIDLENETVGLITYMRTDSIRLSDIFVSDAKKYIEEVYGKNYVGRQKLSKKTENVQDAHEAIRPTSVLRTPESIKKYLTRDELKLYSLIYARAIASLMASAKFDSTSISLDNQGYLFKASGSILVFDGYLKLYGTYEQSKNEQLPSLDENEVLVSKDIKPSQHFTKPPARYSEAKLIKEMEELGIGRPSTYAFIIDTIQSRDYVELKDKAFYPTETGILTNDQLALYFNEIINVEYTAQMEKSLDEIAEGTNDYESALRAFDNKFEPLLENAKQNMKKLEAKKTGEKCPECGHDLVERKGRYGTFVACSNYPECKYIKKDEEKLEYTGETCPKCGSPMVFKRGLYGRFEACGNYPECKYIKGQDKKKAEPRIVEGMTCPKCGSPVVIKRGRFGEFYACSNYPKCKNILGKVENQEKEDEA